MEFRAMSRATVCLKYPYVLSYDSVFRLFNVVVIRENTTIKPSTDMTAFVPTSFSQFNTNGFRFLGYIFFCQNAAEYVVSTGSGLSTVKNTFTDRMESVLDVAIPSPLYYEKERLVSPRFAAITFPSSTR